ncbi:Outer membrane protein TolC [Paraburkholderia caffeinitolerans]|uniref:Protein CyaE n=1 Tax=Paraburkholderia caffeinitolerans TaxID=1723730 RepID=A0A6J5GSB8_9BURK|nr:TolC family protein [Paraburkholderia caffeinitolerans]CAB3802827.1 Outer membrane protein TolC [Paraburkholderia caffeinitolerans]
MNARQAMLLLAATVLCHVTVARAFDPLRTQAAIPATSAGSIVSDPAGCVFGDPGQPLTLAEAVQRALCSNPRTREAWADVKAQAAGVGVARAAYLPTLTGNAQIVRDDSSTDVSGHPQLGSDSRSSVHSESVSLSWTLYDFGARSAALRNANALLAAAQSAQDAAIQALFVTVAKDYSAAQAAQSQLAVAGAVEQMSGRSALVAQSRVDKGIAPISDALQAKTAWGQAVLARNRAEGVWQTAQGTLAADMDLSPDRVLDLPAVAEGAHPDANFAQSVSELMGEARRTHPEVLSTQAQVDAAAAKVDQTRAQGLPTLSLVSKYLQNNQPASLGLGIPTFPATGHEWYVGVQLTIPIFEGFGRLYQVHQGEAQLERQADALEDARQHVALEVWNSYQAVRTSTAAVGDSETLLGIAEQSFAAAERRYQAGVGSVLELLNAQSGLANAKHQRVQALADWHAARLRLAGSIGKLDVVDLR